LNHHKTIKEIYRNIRVCITKRDITLVAARVGTGAEPKLPEASIAREPAAFTPPKVLLFSVPNPTTDTTPNSLTLATVIRRTKFKIRGRYCYGFIYT
jgi:hypothetical protein